MLTSTFSDYTPITAVNMPKVKYGHIESPSPFTFSGAKGMGEGGAAPVHTMCAALQDALYANGIIIKDSHNPADSLFQALAGASAGKTGVRVEHRKKSR
jgi:2-furoyl-CoA dehydrogenase large subunit